MTVAEVRIGDRRLGEGSPALLVAEIGSNHNRDLRLALRLIDMTAEAGWDAVKFQLFRAAWLYPPTCGKVETPMGLVDFYEVLAEAEMPWEWLPELTARAERLGLLFLCAPFDEAAVGALEGSGLDAYKIASPELNHLPLARAIARTGRPIVASTGISTLCDIEEAVGAIRAEDPGAQIALLQCTSSYPTPLGECNLAAIGTLRRAFGLPVGFSDHTTDTRLVPAVAAGAGACLIEKHVTVDRTLPGPDHTFALELEGMSELAGAVRAVEAVPAEDRLAHVRSAFGAEAVDEVLGHGRKEIMPSESPLYPCDKRSIHALRDLEAGEPVTRENARILRSERNLTPGLHPRHWDDVMGAVLTSSVAAGDGIRWEHLIKRRA